MGRPADPREQIETGLADLREKRRLLATAQEIYTAELSSLHAAWQPKIEAIRSEAEAAEKALAKIVKKNSERLFPSGADRADFDSGTIWHKVAWPVKRIKGMLGRLQNANMDSAIKVSESVIWDEVERMDAKTLAALGTERIKKESFEFEIKDDPQEARKCA